MIDLAAHLDCFPQVPVILAEYDTPRGIVRMHTTMIGPFRRLCEAWRRVGRSEADLYHACQREFWVTEAQWAAEQRGLLRSSTDWDPELEALVREREWGAWRVFAGDLATCVLGVTLLPRQVDGFAKLLHDLTEVLGATTWHQRMHVAHKHARLWQPMVAMLEVATLERRTGGM